MATPIKQEYDNYMTDDFSDSDSDESVLSESKNSTRPFVNITLNASTQPVQTVQPEVQTEVQTEAQTQVPIQVPVQVQSTSSMKGPTYIQKQPSMLSKLALISSVFLIGYGILNFNSIKTILKNEKITKLIIMGLVIGGIYFMFSK